jgi:hypothetical protein
MANLDEFRTGAYSLPAADLDEALSLFPGGAGR